MRIQDFEVGRVKTHGFEHWDRASLWDFRFILCARVSVEES